MAEKRQLICKIFLPTEIGSVHISVPCEPSDAVGSVKEQCLQIAFKKKRTHTLLDAKEFTLAVKKNDKDSPLDDTKSLESLGLAKERILSVNLVASRKFAKPDSSPTHKRTETPLSQNHKRTDSSKSGELLTPTPPESPPPPEAPLPPPPDDEEDEGTSSPSTQTVRLPPPSPSPSFNSSFPPSPSSSSSLRPVQVRPLASPRPDPYPATTPTTPRINPTWYDGPSVCPTCGNSVKSGQTLTAAGRQFHTGHFICFHCGKDLANKKFRQHEGRPYCAEDYVELFSTKCAGCRRPIVGKYVNLGGEEYHIECLTCFKCGIELKDRKYMVKDQRVYCEDDYHQNFGTICVGCGKPILDKVLRALNSPWHPDCFMCSHCLKPLEGLKYVVKNDNVYCQRDYQNLFSLRCKNCGQIIEKSYVRIETVNQNYHSHCLICCICKLSLNNKQVYCDDNSDDIFCKDHYEKQSLTTVCAVCREFIQKEVLNAFKKTYHPHCFVCLDCKRPAQRNEKNSLFCDYHGPNAPQAGVTPPSGLVPLAAEQAKLVDSDDEEEKDGPEESKLGGDISDAKSEMGDFPPDFPEDDDFDPEELLRKEREEDHERKIKQEKFNAQQKLEDEKEAELRKKEETEKKQREEDTRKVKEELEKIRKQQGLAAKDEEERVRRATKAKSDGDEKRKKEEKKKLDEKEAEAEKKLAELEKKDREATKRAEERKEKKALISENLREEMEEEERQKEIAKQAKKMKKKAAKAQKAGGKDKESKPKTTKKARGGLTGHMGHLASYISFGVQTCCPLSAADSAFKPDYRKKDIHHIQHNGQTYEWMDYAPKVFQDLRSRYGITQEAFNTSIGVTGINGGDTGAGKSGMLFFFSNDKRYILKTITKGELKFTRKILKSYHKHLQTNPHTLISRFYGLYKITMPNAKPVRLIVMNNLFDTKIKIMEKFDLKGSIRNRYVPDSESKDSHKGVLKDLNYKSKMYVGPTQKKALVEQIKSDCALLTSMNIMDQSLLLGVHNGDEETDPSKGVAITLVSVKGLKEKLKPDPLRPGAGDLISIFQTNLNGVRAFNEKDEPRKEIYYMGVIDILQEFNMKKQFESAYKGIKYNKNAISAVSSKRYADRFMEYLFAHME